MGVSEFRRSVMIWAKEETMSRNEIEAVQLERLKDTTIFCIQEDVYSIMLQNNLTTIGIVKGTPFFLRSLVFGL